MSVHTNKDPDETDYVIPSDDGDVYAQNSSVSDDEILICDESEWQELNNNEEKYSRVASANDILKSTVPKKQLPNIVLYKQFNSQQSAILTNTVIYGMNFAGVVLGITSLLAGLGIEGLTINQSYILELAGAGLLSFCTVKCIKCMVKIGCPLDGKEALIPDTEEPITNSDTKIKKETPIKLELTRNR